MEILFISHKYPPTIGGMEKQCFELVSHAEHHHKVHKLVFTGETESKLSFFWKLRSRVKKILADHPEIEIIHLNDGLMGIFSTWLKSYTEIPVVLTFHGLDLIFPNALYQKYIRTYFKHYDGFICVSRATGEACKTRQLGQEKVHVVPNGVDHAMANFQCNKSAVIQKFKAQFQVDLQGKKVLVLMGRPVQRKGFSWFLEQVVPHLDEDIQILIIGPFAQAPNTSIWKKLIPANLQRQIALATTGLKDETRVHRLLQDPQINSKVTLTGKLPYLDLQNLLSIADLFIMPNVNIEGDFEGFGLVALEASLSKAVVLASNLEGIPDAVQDQKNGFLLPAEDAEAWRKKIKHLLSDPGKLTAISERFQQFTLEHYGWQKMTDQYIEVFEKVRKKEEVLEEVF